MELNAQSGPCIRYGMLVLWRRCWTMTCSINWRTSTMCHKRHHQPRLVFFEQVMSNNGKLHRPCDIFHRSPASVVAYAYFSVDVCNGMPASVVACAHCLVIVWCVKVHRSRELCYGVSALVRWHLLLHVVVEQETTANNIQHKLIPSRINCGTWLSTRRHRSWPTRINLASSFNGKQHHIRHACIRSGVCASTGRHRSWPPWTGEVTSASDRLHYLRS